MGGQTRRPFILLLNSLVPPMSSKRPPPPVFKPNAFGTSGSLGVGGTKKPNNTQPLSAKKQGAKTPLPSGSLHRIWAGLKPLDKTVIAGLLLLTTGGFLIGVLGTLPQTAAPVRQGVKAFLHQARFLVATSLGQVEALMENTTQTLHAPGLGQTEADVHQLWQDTLAQLRRNDFQAALPNLERLTRLSPGLLDVTLLHLAHAFEAQPDEAQAQLAYTRLLQKRPHSPLAPVALYRLGKSHLRANEADRAHNRFQDVIQRFPKTEEAIAAHYYLAEELLKTKETNVTLAEKQAEGIDHAFAYLQHAPQGAFAKPTLALLMANPAALTSAQKTQLQTLIPLTQAPPATPTDPLQMRWLKVTQAQGPQKEALARAFLQEAPTSAYAAECSWLGLFFQLSRNDTAGFLAGSSQHLKRYPASRSAPKVLFWMGKTYEKLGQLTQAKASYQKLLATYPHDYYAFRAERRLDTLNHPGTPDAGWATSAWGTQALPPNADLAQQRQWLLGELREDAFAKKRLDALIQLQAADDVALLVAHDLQLAPPFSAADNPPTDEDWMQTQTHHQLPQGLFSQALVALANTHPASVIRACHDSLMLMGRLGNHNAHTPPPTLMALLYPTYYSTTITQQAQHHQLNPFIVLGLMREESHFNPQAISSSKALGLMQLLVPTAAEVAEQTGLVSNRRAFRPEQLFDPNTNIALGTAYLGKLHQQFSAYGTRGGMLAVGAYNGGPGAMSRWAKAHANLLTTDPDWFVENIPFAESREYIKKVYASAWNTWKQAR